MLEFQWLWGFCGEIFWGGGGVGCVFGGVGSGGKGWDCGGFGW